MAIIILHIPIGLVIEELNSKGTITSISTLCQALPSKHG
jgi:hypothetical protein